MLQRLNYYSRYNRIKNPKDISSLYHLLNNNKLQVSVLTEIRQQKSTMQHIHQSSHNYKQQFINALNLFQPQNCIIATPISIDLKQFEELENSHSNQNYEKSNNNISLGNDNGEKKTQQNQNKRNISTKINCLQISSTVTNRNQEQNKQYSPIRQILLDIKQDNQKKGQRINSFSSISKQFEAKSDWEKNRKKGYERKRSNLDQQFDNEELSGQIWNNTHINKYKQKEDNEDQNKKRYFVNLLQKFHQKLDSDTKIDEKYANNLKETVLQRQQKNNLKTFGNFYLEKDDTKHSDCQKTTLYDKKVENSETISQLNKKEEYPSTINKTPISISTQIVKIPKRGLTQGILPSSTTQQSITGKTSPQISSSSPTHSTYQNNPPLLINSFESERKSFKKWIKDKKLNPRLAVSTIHHDNPVNKVNFKKMLKKSTCENIKNQEGTVLENKPQNRRYENSEQNKLLLKAFFDQN